MYERKGIVYADAGKYLVSSKNAIYPLIGYQLKGSTSDFEEKEIKTDDMAIKNGIVFFSDGNLAQPIIPNGSYDSYKASFVKKRYSNDDQIAIILNKDLSEDDLMAYEKMQEWRDWASQMSKSIMALMSK